MQAFPAFGYLALNVVQDERTNGAKPAPENYTDLVADGKTLQVGPTGGWCTCFRRADYRKLRWLLEFYPLSMKRPEDSFLSRNFKRFLNLESGIIKDAVCLHACGPYFAKQFGHLDREIEKYTKSGLPGFVAHYDSYRDR